MFEALEQLGSGIQAFILLAGYPGVMLVMFLECVFPPIPSELVLPYAGFLIGRGEMGFAGAWLSSIAGSLLGALALYYVGRWSGDHVVRGFLQRWGRWLTVSEADYDRALRVFHQHGEVIIFVGRLVPVIRSLISIPAGADHMPLGKFCLYTLAGSALWNGILVFAGIQLGENWERVMHYVAAYQHYTMLIIAVALVALVVVHLYRKRSLLWR